MSSPELALVAETPSAVWADTYVELLRREGIRTLVRVGGPGYGAWGAVGGLPHKIYVAAPLWEGARALLEDAFGPDCLADYPRP
jgi:hypothetical protein